MKRPSFRLTIMVVAVFFLVALVISVLYTRYGNNADLTPSGTIYLSLTEGDPHQNHINIYTFDVGTKEFSPWMMDGESYKFTPSISPDGSRVAFAYSGSNNDTSFQIVTSQMDGSNLLARASGDSFFVRRNPVWSPDGRYIAYMGRASTTSDPLLVTSWSVSVIDLASNKERIISDGTNPMFAPDGTLLVLREDGLYRFSIEGSAGENIWPIVEGTAGAEMKLNISKDGERIVWTVPRRDVVLVIAVDSWDKFKAHEENIISASAFWPVFSPDGNFLALQEVDGQGTTNPRLVVYDIKTLEKKLTLDLNQFLQDAMYITDWEI